MAISVISDINQAVHHKMPHQICIYTIFVVSLGVRSREGVNDGLVHCCYLMKLNGHKNVPFHLPSRPVLAS